MLIIRRCRNIVKEFAQDRSTPLAPVPGRRGADDRSGQDRGHRADPAASRDIGASWAPLAQHQATDEEIVK